jgi:hypothetical protein
MSARRWLAGDDGAARTGLPVAELLAPLPLVALAALVVNDWLLKGSSAPEWLTGKLSDVAGLFVFPLIATAAFDLVLYAIARAGVPVDFTLRRWKLAATIAFTVVVFGAMKIFPDAAAWVARALGAVFGRARVEVDPTDLGALVVLAGTWWYGRRTIARGSYGRVELARRRHAAGRPLAAPFDDARRCGADPAIVDELERALAADDSAAIDAALAKLRA